MCLKSLQGRDTFIVHYINSLERCNSTLISMVLGSQTEPTGFDALLQAADGGDVYVQVKSRTVSRGGLVQFIESQGFMTYNLFWFLTRAEQNYILRSVGFFDLHMSMKIDILVGLRNCNNAALTKIVPLVLLADLVPMKPCGFYTLLSAQHRRFSKSFTLQKIADIEDEFTALQRKFNST